MRTDDYHPVQATRRLFVYWRATHAGFRYCMKAARALLRAGFVLVVAAYFLFCALFLTLRHAVLPNIDRYKPEVEQMASRVIGRPVSIATIDASWHGLMPKLVLGGVVIHHRDGRQALNLPSVAATFSWWSALVADVRLYTLEISRPDVDIRRDADGTLSIAGIPIDTQKSGDAAGADWLLSQREIVIRDGRVRWNDVKRGAPELALGNVNFILHNAWQRHRFALHARPPAAFAPPVDVRASFDHPPFARRISDFTQWRGELYTDLRDTDLTAWKAYLDYPVEIAQGRGAVRAWLEFDRMRVADFTADLTLADVAARLRPDLPPLQLAQVSGRVSLREIIASRKPEPNHAFGAQGHALALTDFSMQTRDGLVLPTTTIRETYLPAAKDKPEKTEISARLLDLRTLADFAERLPLPAAQRQLLADFAPRGQVRDFTLQWQGAYPDISAYGVKGEFTDLALKAQAARPARPKGPNTPAQAALPAIPGVENLSGRVDATERGGSFSLASRRITFELPGVFSDPKQSFDVFEMRANWAFLEHDKLQLDIAGLDFVKGGMSGSFAGSNLMPLSPQQGKSLGMLDLRGRLNGFEIDKVGQYLPAMTPRALRDWLTGALQGGTANDVHIRVRGDLADFPFVAERPTDKPKGEFNVAGKIDNGKLLYSPGDFGRDGKMPLWPALEQIKGRFVVDRARMVIEADSAQTHGAAVTHAKAVIPDLRSHDKLLEIEGDAAGALKDFLRYAGDSPVDGWIEHFTDETRASGDVKLNLKLHLTLARLTESKVQGTLRFADNEIHLLNGMPALSRASGRLEFNEKGFNLAGVTAQFLGGPVGISGGTQRDGGILIKGEGSATAEGFGKAYPGTAAQRLAEHMSGALRYNVTVGVKKGRPEIAVESSLQGLALGLPAPLTKSAAEAMPLRFELTPLGSDEAGLRDELRLALGPAIAARYVRHKANEKHASWRVLRGGIGVNAEPALPESGVLANFNMKALNLDAWGRLAAAVAGGDKGRSGAGQADGSDIAQYVDPEILAARAGELVVLGKKLDNVVVGASHQQGMWLANINSDQASGHLNWHPSVSGRGLGRVSARLATLIVPKSAASDVTELLEGRNEATQIPALDIVVERFEFLGKKLGYFELEAHNTRAGGLREWRIGKLSLVNPDAELRATGKWSSREGDSLSSLSYTLDITDAGRLLNRFGFPDAVRGGKGKMHGDLSWKGLPYSIDIPSMSGSLLLDLGRGQFLKVDPGAAKLLGVLSLQSLPRRLTLDFRDVFSEGFAFDGITGSASIAQGVATTDNLKMRSVSATVLMDGTADIAKETQDLHVVVIPEINAAGASVVYGLAVNPVIGVGTFLAQLFLREPLMRAFTHEYKITGEWQDPVVNKLERKHAAPDKPAVAAGGS